MSDEKTDIGPQCESDSRFTARMRWHQSWYRATMLRLKYGTGPNPESNDQYGNMLTETDAEQGRNFLNPRIYEAASSRLQKGSGVIEAFRLKRNMLSSQPMAFNLFGMMVADLDTATRLWRALLGDEVQRVERVELEYAPAPKEQYLNDATAFDAFVEYRRPDGKLAFTGIECKLTEPFSSKTYDTVVYQSFTKMDGSPWQSESWDRLAAIEHNQLWRDHLLAVAMLRHPKSKYAHGRLMLVRHPGDEKCAKIVLGYKNLLRNADESFVDMPLDRLVGIWGEQDLDESWRTWLQDFHLRYIDLNKSESHSR